jgi:primosomal replication protein N
MPNRRLSRRLLPRRPERRRDRKLNRLALSGDLVERRTTRYTPAGIPVCEARLRHAETAAEAGGERQVAFEITVLALGDQVRWLESAALGTRVSIEGFLAPKSRNSRQLVLHMNHIEFLEG